MHRRRQAETNEPPPYDETKVLRLARQFDEDALSTIYQVHHAEIYRYVYHHLGDAPTAQDLASEVFRRFLKALRFGTGPTEQVSAWLYRVAHNLIVDELRYRANRAEMPWDDGLDDTLDDGAQSPEEMASHSLTAERIRTVLLDLTPEQRQVIVLRFIEGMSSGRVAQITGKTEGAVKALQFRALETLRERLGTRRQPASANAVGRRIAALGS